MLIAGGLLAAHAPGASAQAWPTKPVRVIVPFTGGSGTDIVARTVTEGMSKLTGQPFVIENRAGAGGGIAAQFVAHAAPDGYTLLLATNGMFAINPHVYKSLGYDPEKDFEPIALVAHAPAVIVARKSLPATNMKEFVAYAKAKPGLPYANPGTGSSLHLGAELFKQVAGIDLTVAASGRVIERIGLRRTFALSTTLMGFITGSTGVLDSALAITSLRLLEGASFAISLICAVETAWAEATTTESRKSRTERTRTDRGLRAMKPPKYVASGLTGMACRPTRVHERGDYAPTLCCSSHALDEACRVAETGGVSVHAHPSDPGSRHRARRLDGDSRLHRRRSRGDGVDRQDFLRRAVVTAQCAADGIDDYPLRGFDDLGREVFVAKMGSVVCYLFDECHQSLNIRNERRR